MSDELLSILRTDGVVTHAGATLTPLTGGVSSEIYLVLKVGSFARGERAAKWNEVLCIERRLDSRARFADARIYERILPR